MLRVFELPVLDDALLDAPRVTVTAAGEGIGWRSAALLTSVDDGATWVEAGTTATPATIGIVEVAPGVGSVALVDRVGTLVVRLATSAMLLDGADDAALDRGANLALVGNELVQFGVADPLGGARWRLSRLLRGRRGTEWATGAQIAGDRFILVEPEAMRTIALPPGSRNVRVIASGVGDDQPVGADAIIAGASILPPSVARLRWEPTGETRAIVRWVRRSRIGWRWIDGADVPLGEETEAYAVTVSHTDGSIVTEVRAVPWIAVARPATVTVRQRGTHGDSRAATLTLPG